MTTLLTRPWRIDRRGERIYIEAPGEVCVDVTSGTPEDRARVMALLEQVQRFAVLAQDAADVACEDRTNGTERDCFQRSASFDTQCGTCRARTVLRDAGLMSGADDRGDG